MKNLLIGAIIGGTLGLVLSPSPKIEYVNRIETQIQTVDIIREVEVRVPVAGRLTRREHDLLAATMWGEARGDGIEGMRAVGHVIMNRVDSPHDRRYGATIEEVILKPYQFSVWNANDPNRERMLNLIQGGTTSGEDYEAWLIARELARQIASGSSEDPTNGALYYHTHNVSPSWAEYGENALTLASHVFYTDASRN